MAGGKRDLDTRASLRKVLPVLCLKGGTQGMAEWNQCRCKIDTR